MFNCQRQRLFRSYLILFALLIGFLWVSLRKLPSTNQLYASRQCKALCSYISKVEGNQLKFNSIYSVRNFPDFVCPQNFRNLADWVFGWPHQFFEHMEDSTKNGREVAPCLPPGSIIYVRARSVDKFFTEIYPYLIHNFVLITGEGDESFPVNFSYLNRADSKIIHWFGQNGDVHAGTSPKFTHIPIGINCYEMSDAIKLVHKRTHPKRVFPPLYDDDDEPAGYTHLFDMTERALSAGGIDQSHLALINFDPGTDGTGLRSRVWSDMCNADKPIRFVECIKKQGGVHIFKIQRIYPRNRRYAFWISPRGNGLDCHRTWEALYLDIIPIVWNSTLNSLYEDLPIVIINNHTEITEPFLREHLRRIATNKQRQLLSSVPGGYRYEKLANAYWRRIILSKSRYSTSVSYPFPQQRCWAATSTILEWSRYVPFLKYTSIGR